MVKLCELMVSRCELMRADLKGERNKCVALEGRLVARAEELAALNSQGGEVAALQAQVAQMRDRAAPRSAPAAPEPIDVAAICRRRKTASRLPIACTYDAFDNVIGAW